MNKPIKILLDIVFLILFIALIIPSSRMFLVSNVQRIIATKPKILEIKKQITIPEDTYDWKLQTLDGEVINFNEFKDKVIFLNFWATWCPPCVAELPSIQSLYDEYNDKMEFVFIVTEETKIIQSFLNKEGYQFPNFYSFSEVPDVFQSRTIPKTFVISKHGKILVEKNGAAVWNNKDFKNNLKKWIDE